MAEIYKTKLESRQAYTKYVEDHISNVKKAFELFGEKIIKYIYDKHYLAFIGGVDQVADISDVIRVLTNYVIPEHDKSKYEKYEFSAYAAKFFPCEEDLMDEELIYDNFNKAWNHHKKVNKHHPEFYCFGDKPLRIPLYYFVEMICDWIAMSMHFNSSTYDWWFNTDNGRKEKSQYILPDQLELVDKIIDHFKEEFDFSK